MSNYVMLSRFAAGATSRMRQRPEVIAELRSAVERYEGKVLGDYVLLGDHDYCMLFQIPDNSRALAMSFESEVAQLVDGDLMPAIDLPLFQRLVGQTTETGGPHPWQVTWWATLARQALRSYAITNDVRRFCKPMTVVGREHFATFEGPSIIIANHSSHMDFSVLFYALPERVKWRFLFGAAADRWFLKGLKGMRKQPWWYSLAMACFPIQRGGGTKSLDYARWLLDQGWNICIFPEGTRSTTSQLGRFRPGVAILALEKNVPVVPIYMSGLQEMWPKGVRRRDIKPGPARAEILEPVHFREGTSVSDATQMIFERMNEAHQRATAPGAPAEAPAAPASA